MNRHGQGAPRFLTATIAKLRAIAERAVVDIDGLVKPTEAVSEMVPHRIAVSRSEL